MKGEDDWLFFILSTRLLPPVVVAIPMVLMYRIVGLSDSHLGLIILDTAFDLSFSGWLMKGIIEEFPREYEEAALVDGYTRIEAFPLRAVNMDRGARTSDARGGGHPAYRTLAEPPPAMWPSSCSNTRSIPA